MPREPFGWKSVHKKAKTFISQYRKGNFRAKFESPDGTKAQFVAMAGKGVMPVKIWKQ